MSHADYIAQLKVRVRSPEHLRARLEARRRVTDAGCWEWNAGLHELGYARIKVDGRLRYVHRVAYELYVGPIPDGLDLDHVCRNRACFNPEHMEPVTHAENMRRSDSPAWVAHVSGVCQRGHDLNDYVITNAKTGTRACRKCRNQMSNERRARQRARDRERRAAGAGTPAESA